MVILFCISCLGNEDKMKYKEIYTVLPTDSSSFSISLHGIESIKTPAFTFDGKWKLVTTDSPKTKPLYLIFEGRKIYSTFLKSDSNFHYINQTQNTPKDNFKIFAIYNKCPDDEGTFNKNGHFLVIGSGNEKLICYKILFFSPTKFILYDVAKGGELEFMKVEE